MNALLVSPTGDAPAKVLVSTRKTEPVAIQGLGWYRCLKLFQLASPPSDPAIYSYSPQIQNHSREHTTPLSDADIWKQVFWEELGTGAGEPHPSGWAQENEMTSLAPVKALTCPDPVNF